MRMFFRLNAAAIAFILLLSGCRSNQVGGFSAASENASEVLAETADTATSENSGTAEGDIGTAEDSAVPEFGVPARQFYFEYDWLRFSGYIPEQADPVPQKADWQSVQDGMQAILAQESYSTQTEIGLWVVYSTSYRDYSEAAHMQTADGVEYQLFEYEGESVVAMYPCGDGALSLVYAINDSRQFEKYRNAIREMSQHCTIELLGEPDIPELNQESTEENDGSEHTADGRFVFHGRTIDIEMNDEPFGLGLYVSDGMVNEIREDDSPYICITSDTMYNEVIVQYAYGDPSDIEYFRGLAENGSDYDEVIEVLPYESNIAGQNMFLYKRTFFSGEIAYAALYIVNDKCMIYANVNLEGVSEQDAVDFMRSICWQEHEMTEAPAADDEIPEDIHYVFDDVSPEFEMDILGEVKYRECSPGGYFTQCDDNMEEMLLITGPGILDLGKNGCDLSFTARHVRDYSESFDEKLDRAVKQYTQPADGYSEYVYRNSEVDGVTMHLFTYLIPDDDVAYGTGGTTAWVKLSDDTYLELQYIYRYRNAERFEKRALQSLASVKWR